MAKYRFDNSYQCVYKKENGDFVHFCSYNEAQITKDMSNTVKTIQAEELQDQRWQQEDNEWNQDQCI